MAQVKQSTCRNIKCRTSALKKLQDVHYNAYYINYKLNFLKNENKTITTKQMALLSTKARIHYTAIPMETKQG